jgi:hypothetical protein
VIPTWAVRPDDFLQSLNQHRPHVVHFSGHGNSAKEIILLDNEGKPKPVSKQALVSLFHAFKDSIQVVVLNACYSSPQAKAITEVIDCTIGMKGSIRNDAAITFAASFYRAIGFGESIQKAVDQAKASLTMEGIPDPIHLMTRAGVTAQSIILVNPPSVGPPLDADKGPAAPPPVQAIQVNHHIPALEIDSNWNIVGGIEAIEALLRECTLERQEGRAATLKIEIAEIRRYERILDELRPPLTYLQRIERTKYLGTIKSLKSDAEKMERGLTIMMEQTYFSFANACISAQRFINVKLGEVKVEGTIKLDIFLDEPRFVAAAHVTQEEFEIGTAGGIPWTEFLQCVDGYGWECGDSFTTEMMRDVIIPAIVFKIVESNQDLKDDIDHSLLYDFGGYRFARG